MSVDVQDEMPGRKANWPPFWLRVASIALATVLFPVIFYGAKMAWDNNRTRVEEWLPEEFQETADLLRFIDRFGSDELLMIGWPDSRLGSPELAELRKRLLVVDETDSAKRKFFVDVWTGDTIEESMLAPPLKLTRRQAEVRMRGWILGRDGATAAIARLAADGIADRHAAIQFARRVSSEVTGLPVEQVWFAGPTLETVFIDESSKSSLLELNGYSFLVCIAVLLVCTRRIFYSFVIFMIAIYNEQTSMAVIHFTGGQMDSILLLTANLTGVLSISAAIHMFGYFRDAEKSNDDHSPAWLALRQAFLPTCLAALTTCIGFGSLAMSRVVPVHKFGFYSALVVPLAAMLTLWYLAMYLPCRRRERSVEPATPADSLSKVPMHFLCYWKWILAASLLLVIVGGEGARRLRTAVGIHDLFEPKSKLIQDYRSLEQHVGPLVPIETVLELPFRRDDELLQDFRWLAVLQAELLKCDAVKVTISPLNFAPPIPRESTTKSLGAIVQQRVFNSRLEQSLDDFESLRFLYREGHSRDWRTTLRVEASIPQNFPNVMAEIRQASDRALKQIDVAGAKVSIVGGVPLAARTQQRLLDDLAMSFVSALVLIGLTVAAVFRSFVAGIASLLPNVLPALLVFGAMGWLGWKAELGGVMTASAVLGIAIDDSLHLIFAYRSYRSRGLTRQIATAAAVRLCRSAMVQTTLVCGFGMLVFAFSPFVPIQRFAWLMFTLLMIALFADLILLPAILVSPLGEFFAKSNRDSSRRLARVDGSDRADAQ